MSDQKIMAALQTKLIAFATTEKVSVAFEGISFTPDTSKTYLADFLLPAETDNPSIGVVHSRFIGIYQVDVNAPSNTNVVTLRTLANKLAAHFPRGLTLTSGGQTVWITRTPSISQLIPDAGRMKRSVSIRYQSDVKTT